MRKSLGLACLLLAACAGALAAEPPAIPDRAATETFKDAPAPWRDYLVQARAAERISDPLQRCLAFPDILGNKWPAGHAAAHCRHHFGVKRPTLDEIAGMVERKEMAQLEALFDEGVARHFSQDDFSDDIHDTFNYLLTNRDNLERIDRITTAWLQQAPNSAYANLARGAYYNGEAWRARGGQYVSETPWEDLRRMSELVGQAIPYFEKAISINPRLMPAYTGMIDMGRMDSRDELVEEGIRGAEKWDPACPELATQILISLEPRWGGSYEQMLAYTNKLSASVARRPQLGVQMAKPFADRGDMLVLDDQYTKTTLDVLETAIAIGSDEGALEDAANVAGKLSDAEPDGWKALAYLLQDARFDGGSPWALRELAWHLMRRHEWEWSLKYSLLSLEREPDSGFAHYVAGAGYYGSNRYPEADREYALAIEDPNQRQASLREVAEMWLYPDAKGEAVPAKAKPYIDQLLHEYPDDGRGWMLDLRRRMITQQPIDVAMIKAVLKKADRSDDWQASQADWLDGVIRQMQAPPQKPKH